MPTEFTLITGDFVRSGGMDGANHALASYLARAGHPVELVAHRVADDLAALPGVRVRAARKPLGSYFLGRWPLRRAAGRAARGTTGRVVANGGNFASPDVNWVHYVHAAYRPQSAASGVRRAKGWVERRLELPAERRAVRAARVVVCNSDRTRRAEPVRVGAVVHHRGPRRVRPEPLDHVPAGEAERADLRAKFGWPADRPVVMFIGALGDRRKGFDTLYDAWSRLCKAGGWDAVLAVVGRGAELPAWEDRVRTAGLTDRVKFLGFRTDVPDLLRAADALAAPTRYEAYGLGVHEALCCGLPAVVSADAGVAERYPPELADWLLPNPDDAADLAARLRRWREDLTNARDRVRPLAAQLRGYTWDDMARHLLVAIGEPA